MLNEIGLLNEQLSTKISFLACKAFIRYRQNGGDKTSPMPDLFTKAHPSRASYSLPTRNKHRFLNYFPEIKLISPSNKKFL